MKNSQPASNNLSDVLLNPLRISPHPPNVPFNNKNESILKTRQRRYAHQISEQKNESVNLDYREIKSAGSTSCSSSQYTEKAILKSKISSAPCSGSRGYADYRSNLIKRERSSGLYTFDSVPSLIPDNNDASHMPRTKRKENVISSSKFEPNENINDPNLPSLKICKSLRPCKSEASPVASTLFSLRVSRKSLQQISKEKLLQLSEKSMQCLSSYEIQNNEPINLTQYRHPNDVSESFEARILQSLVQQNAHEFNAGIIASANVSNLLTSKDFSLKNTDKITPRTQALMCGSYSDEETSSTTTGPCANQQNTYHNPGHNVTDRQGMHNEWKQHINYSQDMSRSTDHISITDSFCNSILLDEANATNIHKSSKYQDYILVHYIPDFGFFYDPKTGIFYESTL